MTEPQQAGYLNPQTPEPGLREEMAGLFADLRQLKWMYAAALASTCAVFLKVYAP